MTHPGTVPAVVSLVTLGVRDVAASTGFYLALGFELSSASVAGEVSFFQTAGSLLAVWGEEALRADSRAEVCPPAGAFPAFRGVALAINVESRAAVDAALETARTAGAQVMKPAGPTDWGGYEGYFADPDGHLWEIAHNPGWPLGADGLPQLPR
jgi:uncharacterized protein